MTRRIFLGLVGTVIAAATTPGWFAAQPSAIPPPAPRRIRTIWIRAHETGIFTIRNAANIVLMQVPLSAGAEFRWTAGSGLLLRPNEVGVSVSGPLAAWQITDTDLCYTGGTL